ncbi:hypothetical protein ACWAT4_13305 [Bradyrhizobium manausense]
MLTRARIEQSISHGARDLRGRFATAWSHDLEQGFMTGEILAMMNHDAERRVQAERIMGTHGMKFISTVCLFAFLGTTGAAVAADPFYVGSWTLTTAVVAP